MAVNFDYGPLPSPKNRSFSREPQRRLQGRRARRLAVCMCLSLALLLTFLVGSTWGTIPQIPFLQPCHNSRDGYQCQPEISHHWGQYSPFFSVPSDVSPDLPSGCNVTFVQVLSRHGSRDPTIGRTIAYASLLDRLQHDVTAFKGKHGFLKDFEYSLGADQLTAFGQAEMFHSGEAFYRRYRQLARHLVPFVRASRQKRVIISARNFTYGLERAAIADGANSAESFPLPLLIIPEEKGSNNTLSDGLCDAFEHGHFSQIGAAAKLEWASIFVPPILQRLKDGMPGAQLDIPDVIDLMDMCPFHTVASAVGAISPFCNLFSTDEWRSYDYYQTLGKFYGHGSGNPLGATQGVGFVNELIARLTGRPVKDHTSVNHTLDDDPRTFPIGGTNVLFADFSHDNDMTSIFSALGLYDSSYSLPNSSIADPRTKGGYAASWTVPFAARAYIEKSQCANQNQEYVRILINDRVVPLKQCKSDDHHRCTLSGFVDGLRFAREGGRFEECFR